jgi:hypothetical protein
MKVFAQFGLCCLLAQGVFAEQHGGGGASGGHGGGVTAGHNVSHTHGSVRTFGSGRYGGYGYGGFYGDFYQPSYDSGYYPPPQSGGSGVMVMYPQAPIVAETAHSVIHEYTQQEDYVVPPGNDGHPILYLIAFRDNTIRAAMTYWVEDGTLHYLDTGHQEKQAPLSSVDRDMSAQLNRERHVPFSIQ